MTNSKNSSNGLKSDEVQVPLKGFKVPYGAPDERWERYIEGMGNGRYRIHSTLKKPHKAI